MTDAMPKSESQGRVGKMLEKIQGSGVGARAMRGTALTMVNVIGSNGLRMLSNIALTRILYPEAFGIMSLAYMFIYGLGTFTDIGIKTSIIQNKHADERRFLDTAWTMQIIRGIVLWLAACALAYPAAKIYEQDILLLLLPVIALGPVIDGFQTTLVAQANRHLRLAQQTYLMLGAQVISLIVTIGLALALKSVWGLAFGALVGSAVKLFVLQVGMTGESNRLCWDKKYALQVIHFGKWVFLATVATFIANISDRAILGLYIDVAELGVYSIGILLGTAPSLLSNAIAGKILFPLYRMKSPLESKDNRKKIFKARRLVSLMTIGASAVLAFSGPYLVDILYDDRYLQAGAMITLLSLRAVPGHSFIGTQNILLAHGDGKRYFIYMATSAAAIVIFTLYGINSFGLGGAIIAYGLSNILIYPLRAVMIAKYSAWDVKGEVGLLLLGLALNIAACALHWSEIKNLFY